MVNQLFWLSKLVFKRRISRRDMLYWVEP